MKEWQQLYTPALLSIPQMAVRLTIILCEYMPCHGHINVHRCVGKRFFEAYISACAKKNV